MGSFSPASPAVLRLEAWEEKERAINVAATGSPSPVPYRPLSPVAPYTHVGHDSQYGAGRRNGRTIRLLILHTTETDTFIGGMSYGARRRDLVSATCYSGKDGELGYAVAESDRPYTTKRWNDESLAVEICGKAAYTEAQWRARPRQLAAITDLLYVWCLRWAIPAVWLNQYEIAQGASPHGSSPVQGINRGICDHREANLAAIALGALPKDYAHIDIGPGLRAIVFADIIPEVARRLGSPPPPDPPPNPPTSTTALLGAASGDDMIRFIQDQNKPSTDPFRWASNGLVKMVPTADQAAWLIQKGLASNTLTTPDRLPLAVINQLPSIN